jgi:hypothetical protein
MDRVQFSPSAGNENLSKRSVSKSSEKSPTSPAGGSGAAYGAQQTPEAGSEPIETGVQQNGPRTTVEKAQEQQRKLNNLTLAVRRVVKNPPDTQEMIRESVGQYFEESSLDSREGGSGEVSVPEINMPGSSGSDVESVQPPESAPAPEIPKTAPPPAVERDSGGGDADGPRGEVVDVVS